MSDDELKAKLLSRRVVEERCWIWEGGWDNSGYGILRANGGAVRVHRLAARLWLGSAARFIAHKPGCPRLCFNPRHLRPCATHAELARVVGHPSRHLGFDNPMARMTPFALEMIFDALLEVSESYAEIAARVSSVVGFRITVPVVSSISRGQAWGAELEAMSGGASSKLAAARRRRKEAWRAVGTRGRTLARSRAAG